MSLAPSAPQPPCLKDLSGRLHIEKEIDINAQKKANSSSPLKGANGASNTSKMPNTSLKLALKNDALLTFQHGIRTVKNVFKGMWTFVTTPNKENTAQKAKAVSQDITGSTKVQNSSTQVSIGEVATVNDSCSVLHADNLTYGSVLVLLSKSNGNFYEDRTMMNLMGSSLVDGLRPDYSKEIGKISTLLNEPNNQIKVIWVAGTESSSEFDLRMSLSQHEPLLALMKNPNVSARIEGGHGISVKPDGTFELQESKGSIDEMGTKLFLNGIK